MPYSLSPHVRCCLTEEGVVLADLKTWRYLSVAAADSHLLEANVLGWPTREPTVPPRAAEHVRIDDLVEALSRHGLISLSGPPDGLREEIKLQQTDALEHAEILEAKRWITSLHILTFLAACLRAAIKLRFWSLDAIVRGIDARKAAAVAQPPVGDPATARRLAAIYSRMRPWVFGAKNHCLFDSLALIEFLSAYGVFPEWVIGLKTQPFAAPRMGATWHDRSE